MTLLHVISLLCRAAALGWSLRLLNRLRDPGMSALSVLLGLLTLRTVLTLDGDFPLPTNGSVPELLISLSALLSVYYLERLLCAKDQSERALRSSEAHFRSLAENAIDVVAVLDDAGRFVYVSPSVSRVLGYTPDELLGRPSLDLVLEEDRPAVARGFKAAMKAPGTSHGTPCRMHHKDGEVRVLQSRGGAVISERGEMRALLNLRDVTAEDASEAEKQRLQAQLYLSQKREMLGSMAGGIAHDFNNLLTPILGSAELARVALPPHSAAREHLLQLTDATQRARTLIQRVLLFSRNAEGRPESVDLPRAVTDVLALLKPSLPVNIEVRTEFDGAAGHVLCDVSRMHQVLISLCTNAAHALRECGGQLLVRIVRPGALAPILVRHPNFANGRSVLVEVIDNGSGMDARTLERAFDPFFSTRTAGDASGLGLSIVQGIVRSLGGVIDVESEVGGGSRFSLLLPVTAKEEPARALQPLPAARRSSQGRVLLVDDDRAVLAVCRELLELLGYDVTPVGDPETALARFIAEPDRFDAVVTDQTMPKMTGVELAKAVTGIRSSLPIVITTGFAEADLFDQHDGLPIAEVVSKPYTLEELGAAIARALERNRPAIDAQSP